MPKYEKFEDLPVWQEAARLYNRVLDLLEEPGVPPLAINWTAPRFPCPTISPKASSV